ncbi:uncharacterized protein LOC131948677 [Physella acuta]|uniref:uncharacterized protein LOC131948677 n=1 Tax=Physella acuta TaxID=109671 RepID=UPI0027DE11D5|nr:uncharacterized protein LOC131948677 [Physella acuta]
MQISQLVSDWCVNIFRINPQLNELTRHSLDVSTSRVCLSFALCPYSNICFNGMHKLENSASETLQTKENEISVKSSNKTPRPDGVLQRSASDGQLRKSSQVDIADTYQIINIASCMRYFHFPFPHLLEFDSIKRPLNNVGNNQRRLSKSGKSAKPFLVEVKTESDRNRNPQPADDESSAHSQVSTLASDLSNQMTPDKIHFQSTRIIESEVDPANYRKILALAMRQRVSGASHNVDVTKGRVHFSSDLDVCVYESNRYIDFARWLCCCCCKKPPPVVVTDARPRNSILNVKDNMLDATIAHACELKDQPKDNVVEEPKEKDIRSISDATTES